MPSRARHVAYIRAARDDMNGLAPQRQAVADTNCERGWPPPVIYAENDVGLAAGHAPELARLTEVGSSRCGPADECGKGRRIRIGHPQLLALPAGR
jgi:hypothetical protein